MIVHLFNSSSVSGPERLVLPALAHSTEEFVIMNLREARIARLRDADPLEAYSASLKLRYYRVDVKKRWDRDAIDHLQKLLKDLQPTLAHAHAVKASVYLVQAKRERSLHVPIVSTHHGVRGLPDWKMRVYEWLYRKRYLARYDRVLAVSTADYNILLRSGIDRAKLRLHMNGIDGRKVGPEERPRISERIRAAWLPNEGERERLFLFGIVGRLSKEKDHARLLEVLAALNQQAGERDWRCLIFGAGELEQSLRQAVTRLNLEKRVLWMGYRPGAGDELAGLDALLSFSNAEGLPINLIEAGWAGTPVFATWVGGVQDLIPDDRYGVRIPPQESPADTARRLRAALAEKDLPRLRDNAARFQARVLQEFTREKWLARLMAIYAELTGL